MWMIINGSRSGGWLHYPELNFVFTFIFVSVFLITWTHIFENNALIKLIQQSSNRLQPTNSHCLFHCTNKDTLYLCKNIFLYSYNQLYVKDRKTHFMTSLLSKWQSKTKKITLARVHTHTHTFIWQTWRLHNIYYLILELLQSNRSHMTL